MTPDLENAYRIAYNANLDLTASEIIGLKNVLQIRESLDRLIRYIVKETPIHELLKNRVYESEK